MDMHKGEKEKFTTLFHLSIIFHFLFLSVLYQPLLKTVTKGKCKIKEGHSSPCRSLGNTNVAQTDAGLYTKDT